MTTYYKNKRGEFLKVTPCYCGGFVHERSILFRKVPMWRIVNCYPKRKYDSMMRVRKEEIAHVKG